VKKVATESSATYIGGIEMFLAKENFRKMLKVMHFYLGFSPNQKKIMNLKILKGFPQILWTQTLKTLIKPYMSLKTLMKL